MYFSHNPSNALFCCLGISSELNEQRLLCFMFLSFFSKGRSKEEHSYHLYGDYTSGYWHWLVMFRNYSLPAAGKLVIKCEAVGLANI